MTRPELTDHISVEDFNSFYWLKEELTGFCRTKGISTAGGKMEISERIIGFLQNGQIITSVQMPKPSSKFDWQHTMLNCNTLITDNYKNTENVRAFFCGQIGPHFHFTVEFLKWMKINQGKTLNEAITEWKRVYALKKKGEYKTTIAPQFEYNTYIRDFMADNPGKSIKDAIQCWKLKRSQKGKTAYSKNDLIFLK